MGRKALEVAWASMKPKRKDRAWNRQESKNNLVRLELRIILGERQRMDRRVGKIRKRLVLVYWDCHNKIRQTGWALTQQTFLSHSSGGWKSVRNQEVSRAGFS